MRGYFGAGLLAVLLTACVSDPPAYRYALCEDPSGVLRLEEGEPQIERGRPVAVVDGLGHYLFSLPGKLLLFDWRVDNHDVSPETEQALEAYLTENGLTDVKVRINQYSPGAEWRRLFGNGDVGGFWRYTLGVLSMVSYTIFPGRLFGGDSYNPYTNTVSIYSDIPMVALHEGAHAKDFAETEWKGSYAALRILPLVPLYQEAIASDDALEYAHWNGSTEKEKEGYEVLYPAYATYITGEGLRWVGVEWWLDFAIRVAGVIPGHIVGRIKSAGVEEETEAASDPE